MKDGITNAITEVVGLDLGDKYSHICVLDRESGQVLEEARVVTSEPALRRRFSGPRQRIAIETGTHSPWVSRLLEELGHEVIVANPRKLRLIYENKHKQDDVDARYLAIWRGSIRIFSRQFDTGESRSVPI